MSPNAPVVSGSDPSRSFAKRPRQAWLGGLLLVVMLSCGCRSHQEDLAKSEYYTSGSNEADQRASQRMAKQRQIEGGGRRGKVKSTAVATNSVSGVSLTDVEKLPLYERLGGRAGLEAIVRDFLPRVLEDPRVNWKRAGVSGKFTSIFNRAPPTTWQQTPEGIARLEQHMIQFLSLATGGPTDYSGTPLKSGHAGMRITNAEFDAAVGDVKASLDNIRIPDREQKELLSVIESTRTIIVTER